MFVLLGFALLHRPGADQLSVPVGAILLSVIVTFSTELLGLCDGYLGCGWVGRQGSWLGCG